jgi:hypothetical protein
MPVFFRVIFWTYQRGGWQFDVISGFILAFIFLTPRTVFDGSAFIQEQSPPKVEQVEQEEQQVTEPAALQTLLQSS